MRHRRILVSAFMALMLCTAADAQTTPERVPPDNALKLSDIIAKIQQRDQFRYVSEIEWDEEGFYDITYFTSDKAKVEIKIDPVTGQPK